MTEAIFDLSVEKARSGCFVYVSQDMFVPPFGVAYLLLYCAECRLSPNDNGFVIKTILLMLIK